MMNSFNSFTVAPMSAGDIIDRAARLYRHNFWALLRIVLGPSLMGYTGTVLYALGVRNFSTVRSEGQVALSVMMAIGGICLWLLGKAAFYAVLGGASRSLVDYLFEGRPILARDVYRAMLRRLGALIGAFFLVILLLTGAGIIILIAVLILARIGVFVAPMFGGAPNWLQALLAFGYSTFVALVGLTLGMLVYSRVVYVPQVMMVEGKGVFGSISRSFSLAGKEIWRITALLLFWLYVAWSVWALLGVLLGSVTYWFGTDPNPFNQNNPFWFVIAYQALTPISEIMVAPVAMLGLTLLYLDSRVRKEGFDVELLANRLLPSTPQMMRPVPPPMPQSQPASFDAAVTARSAFPSILGLNDYAPVRQPSGPPVDFPIGADAAEPQPAPVLPVESPANGAAPREETIEQTSLNFGPAEVKAPARTQEPDLAVAHPVAKTAQRTCRWCGTEAGGEDRFCRVCGSVF